MLNADVNQLRRMGAEFEMTLPRVGAGSGRDVQQTLAQVLTANGVRACHREYSHSPVPENCDVCVETDSSIRGETRFAGVTWFPVEVKTKILCGVSDWEAIVPRTLEICQYLGARINDSTGHHLHVELPEVGDDPKVIRSLFNLIHRFEPVIFGLVSPSRRENSYARAIPAHRSKMLHGCRKLESFRREVDRLDRYYGLNLTHLFGDGPRVEFRYHNGTLSVDKARHWRNFCLQMIQHAVARNCQAAQTQTSNDRAGMENLLVSCGFKVNSGIYRKVSPELRETGKYLLRRWKHFNGKIALRPKKKSSEQPTPPSAP